MQDIGLYSRTRQCSDRRTHRTWTNRNKRAQISCRPTRVQLTGRCLYHRFNSSLRLTIPNGSTGRISKNGDTLWMMGVLRSWYRRLHLISWRSLRTDDAVEVVAPWDATGISNRRPQRCRVRLPTSGSTSWMSFSCL